jgi:thioredoxin 1
VQLPHVFEKGNEMKIVSKVLSAVAIGAVALVAQAAMASEAYTKAAFDKLVAEGKPVVVEFAAEWCSTCKKQAPVVKEIMSEAPFKSITVLKADYDKEADLKKQLNVTKQSTFVVFKGGKEVARSTGQTAKADIAATFGKAL